MAIINLINAFKYKWLGIVSKIRWKKLIIRIIEQLFSDWYDGYLMYHFDEMLERNLISI